MEVGVAINAIRQRWLMIALATMAMAAVGAIFAVANPPTYTATAEGMFSVASPEKRPSYALANGSQYILDRMTGYAQLGRTTPVLTPVVNDLHLQETALTLSGRVQAKSVADKSILEVSAQYDDPAVAARIADATLAQIGETVSHIENGNVKVTAIGPAVVPQASSQFNLIVFTLVGAVAGFVLAVLLAVGLEVVRQRGGWRSTPVKS
jgi:capsular polysaccharide biosynthesis protein